MKVTVPRVSIIIPVFNREDLVGEAVASALAQDFEGFEVVVVDNASTDATFEVCRSFARDPRFRLFRNETNLGPVRNWIRALEHARGPWVKFLFSDDLLHPDCLRSLMALVSRPGVGLAFSAARIGTSAWIGADEYRWESRPVAPAKRFILDCLRGNVLPVSPGAGLFPRVEALQALRTPIADDEVTDFLDHGAGPDLMVYLWCASRAPWVAHDPRALVFFRAHAASISIANADLVQDRYLRTRLAFARASLPARQARQIVAEAWLARCVSHRKLHRPSDVRPSLSSPRPNFLDLASTLGRAAGRAARRWLPRRQRVASK